MSSHAWDSEGLIRSHPLMPPSELERMMHSGVRESILDDDWVDTAEDWREEALGPALADTFPTPDTTRNSLQDASRQLATPGLYGTPPILTAPDGAGQLVIDLLQGAGWATKMQEVQFKTNGMGDYLLRADIRDGGLGLRPVSPALCFSVSTDDRPDEPTALWEARQRWFSTGATSGEYRWAYDVCDVSDPENPSYRVVLLSESGGEIVEEDVSSMFLTDEDGMFPAGGWAGPDYPYREPGTGRPVIPYVIYRAHDTGRPWNHYVMRGAHTATLNESLFWSYVGKSALGATGRVVIAIGLQEPAGARQEGQGLGAKSLVMQPGSMVFTHPSEGSETVASIHEVGPGADLDVLLGFVTAYGLQQLTRWGLNPTDITRVSNSPTSGAALYISARGKREFSDRVRPLFHRADTKLIRLVATLAHGAGLGSPPLDGYSIDYARIPLAPAERASQRDDLDWRIERGHISEIGAYQEEHPGVTEAQALAALVLVQQQRGALTDALDTPDQTLETTQEQE